MLALNPSKIHKLYQTGRKLIKEYEILSSIAVYKSGVPSFDYTDLLSNHDISLFAVFKFVLTTENITQIKISARQRHCVAVSARLFIRPLN